MDGRWLQANVAFSRDRGSVRSVAHAFFSRLDPVIASSRAPTGPIQLFFWQRKPPDARLRFFSGDERKCREIVADVLQQAASAGEIESWAFAIYEPEVRKLGGPGGVDAFHDFADTDSRTWLAFDRWWATTPDPDDRAAEVIAAAALLAPVFDDVFAEALRDHHEVWDVWCNVVDLAGGPDAAARSQQEDTTLAARDEAARDQHLVAAMRAEQAAGAALAYRLRDLALAGELTTGLRAVLAFVTQLTLQRWGLAGSAQRQLAAARARYWDPRGQLRGGYPSS
jgi:thiopeptide-type bacteriocin biosynthesis protein